MTRMGSASHTGELKRFNKGLRASKKSILYSDYYEDENKKEGNLASQRSISMDGAEKEEEIEVKFEEEFKIEVRKEVQAGKKNVDAKMDRRLLLLERNEMVEVSKLKNASRLKLAQCKYDLTMGVMHDVMNRMARRTVKGPEYSELLRKMVLQCLLLLLEKEVIVGCRPGDEGLVQRSFRYSVADYKAMTNAGVLIGVDRKNKLKLPPKGLGGVIVAPVRRHVIVNNSIEARVEDVFRLHTPYIVSKLFEGVNLKVTQTHEPRTGCACDEFDAQDAPVKAAKSPLSGSTGWGSAGTGGSRYKEETTSLMRTATPGTPSTSDKALRGGPSDEALSSPPRVAPSPGPRPSASPQASSSPRSAQSPTRVPGTPPSELALGGRRESNKTNSGATQEGGRLETPRPGQQSDGVSSASPRNPRRGSADSKPPNAD